MRTILVLNSAVLPQYSRSTRVQICAEEALIRKKLAARKALTKPRRNSVAVSGTLTADTLAGSVLDPLPVASEGCTGDEGGESPRECTASRARALRSSSLQLELTPDGTMRAKPSQVCNTACPPPAVPLRRALSESTNGNLENSPSAATCSRPSHASDEPPTELLVATIRKQPSSDLADMIGSLSANNKRRYSVHPKCLPQSQSQPKMRSVAAVSR